MMIAPDPFNGSMPGTASAFAAAAIWVEQLFLGELGVTLAILTVASVGLALLAGRIALRQAAQVVVGCFILFGAPAIAAALLRVGTGERKVEVIAPITSAPVPVLRKAPQFDPYAGAAVPN